MNKPTKGSIEHRSFAGELRAAKEKDFVLTGYAANFNTLSRDLGGFKERLAPGCFKRSLTAGDDVKALFNHNPSMILGRRENGTLNVEEDSRGLKFRVQLNPKSSQHCDIYESVKRGDINECSFAFTVRDGAEDWDEASDERGARFIRRTIRECNLHDVSCVTNPAYGSGTTVQARSVSDYTPVLTDEIVWSVANKRAREIGEQILREAPAYFFTDCDANGEPTAKSRVLPDFRSVDERNRAKADKIAEEIRRDLIRDSLED